MQNYQETTLVKHPQSQIAYAKLHKNKGKIVNCTSFLQA